MLVRTIHGLGSQVESVKGNMYINNCDITVEENLVEQLNSIKMLNSVIKLSDKIIYTNDTGKFTQITEKENEVKKADVSDFYKEEGMAIFINGQMVIGIHPDNLENNLNALSDGTMKIDWKVIKERLNK